MYFSIKLIGAPVINNPPSGKNLKEIFDISVNKKSKNKSMVFYKL